MGVQAREPSAERDRRMSVIVVPLALVGIALAIGAGIRYLDER